MSDNTKRDQLVEAAAKAFIEHGGPECRTDPHIALRLGAQALDLGATHKDITDEMKRQRGA
jgi:hypothetical protein